MSVPYERCSVARASRWQRLPPPCTHPMRTGPGCSAVPTATKSRKSRPCPPRGQERLWLATYRTSESIRAELTSLFSRDRGRADDCSRPAWRKRGTGTPQDPYIVDWLENDPENPLRWVRRCVASSDTGSRVGADPKFSLLPTAVLEEVDDCRNMWDIDSLRSASIERIRRRDGTHVSILPSQPDCLPARDHLLRGERSVLLRQLLLSGNPILIPLSIQLGFW